MYWMTLPLKRYADFSGRSPRIEYWMFYLFQILVIVGLAVLSAVLIAVTGNTTEPGEPTSMLANIFALLIIVAVLGLLIPGIAVSVRRMHDQDKSGWMLLLSLIPIIGGIIVFVFTLLPGTQGPNRYGDDPHGPQGLAETFR
jgi:uncharacterized membrane protein YhaH (DUF805 family)